MASDIEHVDELNRLVSGSNATLVIPADDLNLSVRLADLLEEGGLEEFVQRAHDSLDEQLAIVVKFVEATRPKPRIQPATKSE